MKKNSPSIPKSWIWANIAQVARIYSGSAFPKEYQGKHSGEYPFYKVRDISKTWLEGNIFLAAADNYISEDTRRQIKAKVLPESTIVFAKIGEAIKLNRRAILTMEAIVDNNVMGVHPHEDVIEMKYLFYYFNTLKLGDYSRATTVPSLRKGDVQNMPVPLPPKEEQKRIASKIDELFSRLDAGVKSLSASKVKTEQYRSSFLRSAFGGDVTARWRESNQYPPVQHSESAPEWLPDSWKWKRAGDAFDIILGQSPPSSTYNEDGIGLPFFQGSKEFGLLYPKINRWCSKPVRIAEKGDVLLSVRAPVGDANICPEKACIGRGLAAIRQKDGTQTSFILYLFRALKNIFIRQGTGTTFNAITGNRLRSTRVPIPPQAEQRVIIDILDRHLSVVIKSLSNFEQSHRYAESLKLTILHSAFRGQLVIQNAKDEPAEVLLRRIKKEKKAVSANEVSVNESK